MASRNGSSESRRENRQLSLAELEEHLGKQVEQGTLLANRTFRDSSEIEEAHHLHGEWSGVNHYLILNIPDKEAKEAARQYSEEMVQYDYTTCFLLSSAQKAWRVQIGRELAYIRSLHRMAAIEAKAAPAPKPQARASTKRPTGNRVFLVHGHDEATREKVARFLQTLQLDVIILHEQAGQSRAIIEKLEVHSDVDFAVVLLTPDDVASSPAGGQEPRARQNVIFELGFFCGKLGRGRVCALHKEGLVLPSDYSGVLYVRLDSEGAWKLALARELRAADLPIDMARLV